MGNWGSARILTEDMLDEYLQLTYLSSSEIRQIFNLLDGVAPGMLEKDIHHRFTIKQIERLFPQLRCNPFRDSIYRVFSSKEDGHLSFEDMLDLCSALSPKCPPSVRASWAFQIFDFDDDNRVSLDDLIEATRRLTRFNQGGQIEIDIEAGSHIARMILEELSLGPVGEIGMEDFVRLIGRMPEFAQTFCFKI